MTKIAIMDLDSIAFTIGHPNKVLGEDGQPIKENGKFVYYDKTEEELKASTELVMNDILTKCRCTHYIAFIKGDNTIVIRKSINPSYKSGRSVIPPKWWNFVKQYLIDNWGAIVINDTEVDDICNITKNHYVKKGDMETY